jgi:hypothetical protein
MDFPTVPRQRPVVVPATHARWGKLVVILVVAEMLVTAFAIVAVLSSKASINHARFHVTGQVAAQAPSGAQSTPAVAVTPANISTPDGGIAPAVIATLALPISDVSPSGVLPEIVTPAPDGSQSQAGEPPSLPVTAPTPAPHPTVPTPTPIPQPILPVPTPLPVAPTPTPLPIVPVLIPTPAPTLPAPDPTPQPTPIPVATTPTSLPAVILTPAPTIVPVSTPNPSLLSSPIALPPLLPKHPILLP